MIRNPLIVFFLDDCMINSYYLNPELQQAIKQKFKTEGVVTLLEVFSSIKLPTLSWKNRDDPLKGKYRFAEVSVKNFFSQELLFFIEGIAGRKIVSVCAYELCAGDFSVIADTLGETGVEVLVELGSSFEEGCGGQIRYMDGEGGFLGFSTKKGTVSFVRRGKKLHRFFQYVNHKARGKRQFLILR
jgi:hypothetical protein